ncbi:putative metalloprotease [Catenuloplanes indicus]|uniref:Metalloprotease n=1 Tax=Catenuloplanes indicus TaxID=137267 RepID=A0AAE4B198_9ACTN|nr:putative metalloprotease [Catenuloplanes indicus]
MRKRVVAALVAGAVLALGCAVGTAPGGEPEATTGAADNPGRADTEDEFARDIESAVTVAEQYWSDVFRRNGLAFEPVRQIAPYRADGEVACGQEPIPAQNAVYCSAGDFIAYDIVWAFGAFRKIGDAFVYYLLGHEYAHGVQVRFGLQYEYTIEQELQADCMAGAYIGGSVQAGRLQIEDGDLEELRAGLLAVGDDPSQPWFAPDAHGTAAQRTDAFFTGYQRGLETCDIG